MASAQNDNGTANGKAKRPAYTWVQPVCPKCWNGLQLKTGHEASYDDPTTCCFCGKGVPQTAFQIRVNPGTIPYPTRVKA